MENDDEYECEGMDDDEDDEDDDDEMEEGYMGECEGMGMMECEGMGECGDTCMMDGEDMGECGGMGMGECGGMEMMGGPMWGGYCGDMYGQGSRWMERPDWLNPYRYGWHDQYQRSELRFDNEPVGHESDRFDTVMINYNGIRNHSYRGHDRRHDRRHGDSDED